MFIAFGLIAPNLGSEFVPRLSEGAIAVSVVRLTGTDLADSIEYNTQMEKTILSHFPDEVEHVWSRIGTAEIATDPMGIELTDMFITLKPRDQWKQAHTQAELTELIEQHLRDLPGQRLEFLQPIEMRMNEMVTGVRSDVAVKLLRRRSGGPCRQRQRNRSDFEPNSRRGRRGHRANHRPAGVANQTRSGRSSPGTACRPRW